MPAARAPFGRLPRALPILALAGLSAALAACGDRATPERKEPTPARSAAPAKPPPLGLSDYAAVCASGKGVEGAAAYEKRPGAASPFAYVYKDSALGSGKEAEWSHRHDSTTEPWVASDAKDVQLVACLDVVKADKDHECRFEKGSVIERYRTRLEIGVYEARTGKKLGTESVEKTVAGCPTIALVDKGVTRDYGELAHDLMQVVAAYQPADAPLPSLPATTFGRACDGRPAVGAGKPTKQAGKFNPFATFLREKEGPWRYGDVSTSDFDRKWFVRNLAGQHNEKEPRTSLVVCMTSTRGGKIDECSFAGRKTLTVYTASWKVDVVDASTGKSIQSKAFVGKPVCPMMWKFDRGSEFDAEPGAELQEWLRPIVEPK